MKRRTILQVALGVGAAAVLHVPISAHYDEHPVSVLERFNRQFASYKYADRIGSWSVFFSGLKGFADSQVLVGQWFGWPGSWLHVETRIEMSKDGYYVAGVPDAHHDVLYQPGDNFAIANGITWHDMENEQAWLRVQTLVDDGRRRLLRVMREHGVI